MTPSEICASQRLIALAKRRCTGIYPSWRPQAIRRLMRDHGISLGAACRVVRELVPRDSFQERLWAMSSRRRNLWPLKDGGPFGYA